MITGLFEFRVESQMQLRLGDGVSARGVCEEGLVFSDGRVVSESARKIIGKRVVYGGCCHMMSRNWTARCLSVMLLMPMEN